MRRWFWLLVLACKAPATPVGQAADDDGDGFDVNVDCDDSDPGIHPEAIDLGGDDIDRNCDGEDGGRLPIDGLPFFVEGRDADERFGSAVAVCDANDDGLPDLIGSSWGVGRVHVFTGPLEPGEHTPSDADLELTLGGSLGYYLRCADADGDGRDDLLWTVPDSALDPRYRIAVLFQPAGGFTGAEQPVYVDLEITVESFWAELVDLDADGTHELIVTLDWGDHAVDPPIYVVDARDLTADGVPVADVGTAVATDQARVYGPNVLPDLDGPGDDGLMFCGNVAPYCRVVSDLDALDVQLDQHTIPASTTGGRLAVMDLDGSGTADDLVFARWQEPGDIKVAMQGLGQDQPTWDHVLTVPEGWSGRLTALDDLDGDGIDDLQLTTNFDNVVTRLISGALLADPQVARVPAVSLLTVDAPDGGVNRTTYGDLDGDGVSDPIIHYGGGDDLGGMGVLLTSGL